MPLIRIVPLSLPSQFPPPGECPRFYDVDHQSPKTFRLSSGCFGPSPLAQLQPLVHRLPIDVREECLDVGRPL